MKSMTPFQEALLTATESQFADVPEEELIHIQPSQDFYKHVPGKRNTLKSIGKAIVIAAALSLLVGAVVADRSFSIGKVEVFEYPYLLEKGADHYVIKFTEEIADKNAPEIIKTYYLPTLDVSIPDVDYASISGDGKTFRTLCGNDELANEFDNAFDYEWETDQVPRNPIAFYTSWTIDHKQITFRQKPAKRVPVGEDYHSIVFAGSSVPEIQTETLQIGNYEVLSILAEFEEPFTGEPTWRYYWFWTDGAYMFHLTAEDVEKDYMQQLMESVQPLDDKSPYLGNE